MSRFFGRIGVTLKKGAHRVRARPPGHRPSSEAMARLSEARLFLAFALSRRDLEQDQHDARTLMNFLDGHPTDGHQSVRNQHDPSRI